MTHGAVAGAMTHGAAAGAMTHGAAAGAYDPRRRGGRGERRLGREAG